MLMQTPPIKVEIIINELNSVESLETNLSQNQFIVHTLQAGSRYKDILKINNPDVIIIDSASPKNFGVKICKEIRTFSNIPILVLSSENKPGIIENILNAGADECLTKPASIKILNARLRNLARRYREEKKAILSPIEPHLVVDP